MTTKTFAAQPLSENRGQSEQLRREEVRRALRDLIIGNLVPLEEDELGDDANLVDEVLDSLGIAEVAVFIEEEIGRPLSENEETRATFASVTSVVDFIVGVR